MTAAYTKWSYKGSQTLPKIADTIYRHRQKATPLSPYIVMTDPQRASNPCDIVGKLPAGAAIIYRHYGHLNAFNTAQKLRQLTFERSIQFLIGNDPELAILVGADGVHFPRDENLLGPRLWRRRCPDWVITMAGLKGPQNYSASLEPLDGLFISSIFYSKSPSAGNPIGIEKLKHYSKCLECPVVALGGINRNNAHMIVDSGAAAIAGVEGFI